MNLKNPPIRDRRYLNALRDMPCIVTGQRATGNLAVDPAHIGTAGKGLKAGDDCALPIRHDIHARMHMEGELTVLRQILPDDVLRAALRAYGRELYRVWGDDNG